MLLRRVVSTSAEVAATSKRSVKRDLLAALLADVEGDEVEATVGLLIGEPRQGALGVGWATVARVAEAAGDPRHDPDSRPRPRPQCRRTQCRRPQRRPMPRG